MIALWWIGPCNEQFLKSAVVRLCFHYQAPAYIVTPTWVSSLSVGYLLGRRKRNSICIPETGISAPSLVKSFSGGGGDGYKDCHGVGYSALFVNLW